MRFTRPWRSADEDPFRWLHAKPCENILVLQRPLSHLLQLLDGFIETSQITERNQWLQLQLVYHFFSLLRLLLLSHELRVRIWLATFAVLFVLFGLRLATLCLAPRPLPEGALCLALSSLDVHREHPIHGVLADVLDQLVTVRVVHDLVAFPVVLAARVVSVILDEVFLLVEGLPQVRSVHIRKDLLHYGCDLLFELLILAPCILVEFDLEVLLNFSRRHDVGGVLDLVPDVGQNAILQPLLCVLLLLRIARLVGCPFSHV